MIETSQSQQIRKNLLQPPEIWWDHQKYIKSRATEITVYCYSMLLFNPDRKLKNQFYRIQAIYILQRLSLSTYFSYPHLCITKQSQQNTENEKVLDRQDTKGLKSETRN